MILVTVQHKKFYATYYQSQMQLQSLQLQNVVVSEVYQSKHPSQTDWTQIYTLPLAPYPEDNEEAMPISPLPQRSSPSMPFSHIRILLTNGVLEKLYLIEKCQDDQKQVSLKRFVDGNEFNEREKKRFRVQEEEEE